MSTETKVNIKEEAIRLVGTLPDDATWEDLMYAIYVRRGIELGLEDVEAGRTLTTDEVLRHFNLPPL